MTTFCFSEGASLGHLTEPSNAIKKAVAPSLHHVNTDDYSALTDHLPRSVLTLVVIILSRKHVQVCCIFIDSLWL